MAADRGIPATSATATAGRVPPVSVCIGVDIGTSGCKVVAVDSAGHVVATSLQHYPLDTPRQGWAEQDPQVWWRAADAGVRAVLADLDDGVSVAAIGLCGQMHGLTVLDGRGEVIRPAILWNDQRAAPQCAEITERAGGLPGLLRLVNNQMLPGFTAGKILWLRQHEPANYQRMRHLLNPKDYLRLRMTGAYVTDVSDASGTGLFDVRGRRWSGELLGLLDIEETVLPWVVESHEVTGGLSADVARRWRLPAGLPVVGGGGDSVLQTTSMGVLDAGLLGVTLGTAGIVGGASRTCPDNPDGRLQVSCNNAPGRWHVMGVSLNTGGAFSWLRAALSALSPEPLDYGRVIELARSAPPGSGGLLFLPYLQGERCPDVAPYARGGWVGLTPAHSAAHLCRSVMEGVVLTLREIVAVCADAGLTWTTVRVSGGATVEPFWLRLVADVLQERVATVPGAAQGGAYGAALLAGVGTGRWSTLDEALGTLAETEEVVPDVALSALYRRAAELHRDLFPALDAVFGRLADMGAEVER